MSIVGKLSSLNLKTKIIITVLLLFLGSIWMLTFLISRHLEQDMIAQIEAQQFSTASYIADSIEGQVKLRLESLADIASLITPELISNPGELREFLKQKHVFKTLFRSGLTVVSKEGKGIADYPVVPGRSKASFTELEFFKEVVATLKPATGKPRIGRFSKAASIAFGVPILDRSGQLIGVLTATTSVSDPALLGTIETTSHQNFPDRLILVSRKYGIIITGSDPTRIMTPISKPGVNPEHDKFMAGFEGSGISVNSRGIRMLLTAKKIPTPGWYIRVGLPLETAFAPIKKMKIWAYSLALGLSLLSSLLLWLVIRQTLRPLYDASKLIEDITCKRLPLQQIPVTKNDEIGQLLTSFNTHLDYRKQAEEETRDLMLMLEAVPNSILIHDAAGNFLYANQRTFDLHGYSRDEFMVLNLRQLVTPASEKLINERIKELIDHGETSFEVEHLKKDGTNVPLWINVKKAIWGGKSVFLSVQTDITERKQAERELQAREETAKRLAQENQLIAEIGRIISSTLKIEDVYERFTEKVREAIPFDRIVVSTVNLEDYTRREKYVSGPLVPDDCSERIFSLAGTRTEHVVQTKSSLLINNTNREEMIKQFPGMLFMFGARPTITVPLISKDYVIGVLTLYALEGSVYSENDLKLAEKVGIQISGAIANAQLFLERNRAEEGRQNLEERLHRAKKMEALGQLAGGVAHDLNNVLGVLSGYSELLIDRLPGDSPLRSYATNILNSTQKGAAIIQDLLTLARRGVIVDNVISLNVIVSNLLVSPEFKAVQNYHSHVKIKTTLEKDLLNIKGSSVHLEKTVLNLVSNASEAIVGSGEVKIRTENCYLDKAVPGYDEVLEGDYVVLTVSDTGRGILSADLDKIFEPFYTKKSMGRSGTGLGLAIVWGTVQDHKGYIDVQSREGKGSTFTLYFPVTRETATEDAQKIPIGQYMGHGESVLVVDDVQEQRSVATSILERLGYQANSASSGEEAVEYIKNNKADILVLDMIMIPGIDGLETYIRILEINPKQKAIVVSGFSETDRVREAQKLGAGTYVKKPYVMEKIGIAIRNELDRKEE